MLKTGRRVLKTKPNMPLGSFGSNVSFTTLPDVAAGNCSARPMAGTAVRVDVDITLLEGLEESRVLQKILDRDLVVVVEADFRRNILAPVVGIAFEGDAFARLQRLDLVGTRPDRRRER